MKAAELARTLNIQYRYTSWAFGRALDGLDGDAALAAPAPLGNSIAWVAGHLLDSRGGTLRLLGKDAPFPPTKYARFGRGSAPLATGEAVPAPAEMVGDFAATDAPLKAGLAALTDEMAAARAPFSPGNDPQETVGSLLAGLLFHESYHVGQLGLLRRLAGGDPIVK